MYKKVRCTCEVVVLLIKPIVFLTFSLSSASLDLKASIFHKLRLECFFFVNYNFIFPITRFSRLLQGCSRIPSFITCCKQRDEV